MDSPRMIAIVGMDGSGKTTLARWMFYYARSKGYKTKYVWMRYQHTLAYVMIKILSDLGWKHRLKNPLGVVQYRFELPRSYFAEKLWPYIEFLSIAPLIVFKVLIPHSLGYLVICDRYTIDTVISIAIQTKNLNFPNTALANILLKTIPKKTVAVFLDVDYPSVIQRRPDIEFTQNEIETMISLYRKLFREMPCVRINVRNATAEQLRSIIRCQLSS